MTIKLIRNNQERILVVNNNDSQETKDSILFLWVDHIHNGWVFKEVTFHESEV